MNPFNPDEYVQVDLEDAVIASEYQVLAWQDGPPLRVLIESVYTPEHSRFVVMLPFVTMTELARRRLEWYGIKFKEKAPQGG